MTRGSGCRQQIPQRTRQLRPSPTAWSCMANVNDRICSSMMRCIQRRLCRACALLRCAIRLREHSTLPQTAPARPSTTIATPIRRMDGTIALIRLFRVFPRVALDTDTPQSTNILSIQSSLLTKQLPTLWPAVSLISCRVVSNSHSEYVCRPCD